MGSHSSTPVPTETDTFTTLTTTRLPMPLAGPMPLTASALPMDSDTTKFVASDCSTSGSACVFFEPLTFTAAPGTYIFNGSDYWNILGQYDCSFSESPMTAACAWTVGSYPSSELVELTSSWITTPARSSATIRPTITDTSSRGVQAFVDVTYQEVYYVTKWSGSPPMGPALETIWTVVAAVALSLSVTLFS